MGQKNKYLRRLWGIYALFFGVIVSCIALFIFNVISADDYFAFEKLNEKLSREKLSAVVVSDIHNLPESTEHDFQVENGGDSALIINAHMNRLDVSLASRNEDRLGSPLVTLNIVLQYVTVALLFAIFVFVFLSLCSFYKSIKIGKMFRKRNIRYLRIIGILLILMSLSVDFIAYLDRQYVETFLSNTDLAVETGFSMHFTRILFGIVIIFVAEIFNIGKQMQDDQELTI